MLCYFRYPAGLIKVEFTVMDTVRVRVYCDFRMNLLDGKSRKAMSGRGGAYCYLCDITLEAYHTPGGVRVEVIDIFRWYFIKHFSTSRLFTNFNDLASCHWKGFKIVV
jgi:hypothetical protein